MVAKLGIFSTPRKDLQLQVKLQHPVLNGIKKEGAVDSHVPVVTSLSEKTVVGFSTPPVDKSKSRERYKNIFQHYTISRVHCNVQEVNK